MKEPYEIQILKHLYSFYGKTKDVDCREIFRKIYQELYLELKNSPISSPNNSTFQAQVSHRISKIIKELDDNKFATFSFNAAMPGSLQPEINGMILIIPDTCETITGSISKEGYDYISYIYNREHIASIQEGNMNIMPTKTETQNGMQLTMWILTIAAVAMIFYESLKNVGIHHCH